MNIIPKPPSKPLISKIKRPSIFGRKYRTVKVTPSCQTISNIDTTMIDLPKSNVFTKTDIHTNELLPFIPPKKSS